MGSLRTEEGEERYQQAIANGALEGECALCSKKALESFQFWKVVMNDFPYDRIAKIHHMIVPLRHTTEETLTDEERDELVQIRREYLLQHYDWVLEAGRKKKSIPGHFHLHLLKAEA